jgi:hypothetical protein
MRYRSYREAIFHTKRRAHKARRAWAALDREISSALRDARDELNIPDLPILHLPKPDFTVRQEENGEWEGEVYPLEYEEEFEEKWQACRHNWACHILRRGEELGDTRLAALGRLLCIWSRRVEE